MKTANEKLLDELIGHEVDLSRLSNAQVMAVIKVLNSKDAELRAALIAAIDNLGTDLSATAVDTALSSVLRLNQATFTDIRQALDQITDGLTGYEIAFQRGALQAAIPAVVQEAFPVVLPVFSRVKAIVQARPFQGRLLREWIVGIESGRAAAVRDVVRAGVVEGRTTAEIVRMVMGTRAQHYADGILQKPRREVEAVVRSAISHTAETASDATYEANSDIISHVEWLSTLDNKTSVTCFPGEALALPVGDLRGITRRKWNGDMVVITTASGKQLSSTPNHPVLTARGWRPAQEVQPGSDVLYRILSNVSSVPAAEDIKMPASMSAIFDALNKPPFGNIVTECSSEVDFHGDGVRGDYEVNHPRSKGDLRLALEASLGQEVAEKLLVFIAASGVLPSSRHGDEAFFGKRTSNMPSEIHSGSVKDGIKAGFADSISSTDVGRLYPGAELSDELAFIRSACRVTSSERLHYAGSLEDASDGGGGHAEPLRDTGGSLSFGIVADDVVSVERKFFSGHVYNLSTSTEMYIADGFIVHNCRIRDRLPYTLGTYRPIGHKIPWLAGPGRIHFCCRSTKLPILKSAAKLGFNDGATRASMDGQVPESTTYADWLGKQSAARQDEILGPERGKLLRQGGLKLGDFYNDRGKFLSLEELRARLL